MVSEARKSKIEVPEDSVFSEVPLLGSRSGVGDIQPTGHMRPAKALGLALPRH